MSSVAVFSPAVLPAFSDQPSPETLEAKRSRAVGTLSSSVRPATMLEVRPAPEMVAFGIPALDQLTGGVPRGALTEMVGPASSGRTSLMMSLMASVTRRQEVCALIDVTDSLDPKSAQAAGVDLKRLLWVRCGKERSQEPGVRGQAVPTSKMPNAKRNTMSNVAPPAKNISWSIHENYDARLRHAILGGCHEAVSKKEVSTFEFQVSRVKKMEMWGRASKPVQTEQSSVASGKISKWTRLDQALKATDLLLQGGGFGLIVIDLGDISIEQARRIPLTSWFRFRRVVENTATILLLVARDSCAKTCASLVLQLGAQPIQSGVAQKESVVGSQNVKRALNGAVRDAAMAIGAPLRQTVPGPARECRVMRSSSQHLSPVGKTHINLLDGLDVRVELVRTRLERRPVQSVGVQIETQTSWRKSG